MNSTIKKRKTNPYDLNDILKMRFNSVEKQSIELHRSDPYSAVNINYKKTDSKDKDRKR
jgi:hypothetical protein